MGEYKFGNDVFNIAYLYKSIGLKIVDKLQNREYNDLNEDFIERQKCLDELEKIEYKKEELRFCYEKLNIFYVDKEISDMINFQKGMIFKEMQKLNSLNKISNNYRKIGKENKVQIFNVKL